MASADMLASFEAKWALAHPELPLALRFTPPSRRPLVSALACLSHEIAHAAFRIIEPEVATTKLHWWAEELAAMHAGRARHPLTQVLATSEPFADLPVSAWQALVVGALAQRDAPSAPTLDALIKEYRRLYEPLAVIESAHYRSYDADASAQASALSRALIESIRLPESLAGDRLAVPLDLLARHQLSRGDLGRPGVQRDALLRAHFAALEVAMGTVDRRRLPALGAASLHADQRRSRHAARAVDPFAKAAGNLDRLSISTVWATWRAARKMQTRP